MCRVNVTEFRNNISQYIELSLTQDIEITKNNRVVAVLSNPDKAYYQNLSDLIGCVEDKFKGKDYDDIIGEEILKKCGF